MRILVTNATLNSRSGTEVLTLNLVKTLKSLGHQPAVYAPKLGPIADEIRHLGIPVTDDINTITQAPDVIHGHHNIETATAALRFPDTPAIFVCHDFTAWHDTAPHLPNIARYIAISEGFRTRLTHQDGIAPALCVVILNGIDTQRFVPGPALPAAPRKALIFAKNTQHIAAIQQACDEMNIAHDTVGAAVNRLVDTPETLIQSYDLVFTSAMSALECMAAGRAVIACDGRGLAGFVSLDRYASWQRENFGLPTFNQPLGVANFVSEIKRYDAAQATEVSALVRKDANLRDWTSRYVAAYEAAIADFTPPTSSDIARAASNFLQTWSPATQPPAWTIERKSLLSRIHHLEQGLTPAPLGQTINADNSQQLALSGFHPPEDWGGAWSARARFAIRLVPQVAFTRLTLYGIAYTPEGRDTYNLQVKLNGQPIGTASATATPQPLIFNFDAITDPVVWIEVEGDIPLPPSDHGSTDTRHLGFALTGLALD